MLRHGLALSPTSNRHAVGEAEIGCSLVVPKAIQSSRGTRFYVVPCSFAHPVAFNLYFCRHAPHDIFTDIGKSQMPILLQYSVWARC